MTAVTLFEKIQKGKPVFLFSFYLCFNFKLILQSSQVIQFMAFSDAEIVQNCQAHRDALNINLLIYVNSYQNRFIFFLKDPFISLSTLARKIVF